MILDEPLTPHLFSRIKAPRLPAIVPRGHAPHREMPRRGAMPWRRYMTRSIDSRAGDCFSKSGSLVFAEMQTERLPRRPGTSLLERSSRFRQVSLSPQQAEPSKTMFASCKTDASK